MIGSAKGGTNRCFKELIPASSNCFHPETPRGTASSWARSFSSRVAIGSSLRPGRPAAEMARRNLGELPQQPLELHTVEHPQPHVRTTLQLRHIVQGH